MNTNPDPVVSPAPFDMLSHLARQRAFSEKTFGPGLCTEGVVDHIRKELNEILEKPTDLSEWIDVVILALDGAWRHGGTPELILATLVAKQTKNEARQWPDWRTAAPGKAIEHVKVAGEAASTTTAPAEPVGIVASTVETGVIWRTWPKDLPDGTQLFRGGIYKMPP